MADGLGTNPQRDLLVPEAAADYISVAHRSITSARWRRARGIPAYKLGPRLLRFDRHDLDQWLEERREGPVAVA